MSIIKTKRYLPAGAIGLAMLLSGAVLWLSNVEMGFGIIVAGLVTITTFLYLSTKKEIDTNPDERAVRLNEKAGYVALWLVVLYATALSLMDMFWHFRLTPNGIYTTIQLVGLYSFFIIRFYYGRKG